MPRRDSGADELQELQKLTRKEFANTVVREMLVGLDMKPPRDTKVQLQLVQRFWSKTGRDWHALDLHARDLRRSVTKYGGAEQEITPAVLDRVFGPVPTQPRENTNAQSTTNTA